MEQNMIISSEKLEARIQQISKQMSTDYEGKEIDIVCVVNSGTFFCVDLVRQLKVPVRLHYLSFTSYSQTNNTGEVKIQLDIADVLEGKNIIIMEGIVVSGRTPKYIFDYLKLRNPASIEYCAIGMKPKILAVELSVKYCAFEFEPDVMVAGYGIGKGFEKSLPHLVSSKS